MSAIDVISRVRRAGGRLSLQGDTIRIDAPQGALDEELTALLKTHREEVIALVSRARAERDSDPPVPVRRGAENSAELSAAQQHLWFLETAGDSRNAYLMPAALRLEGPLQLEALRQALEEIVRRHEMLRTSFFEDGGRCYQRIEPAGTWQLPVVDLTHLKTTERDAETERRAANEARQPFDLSAGQLLRTTLLRTAPQEHILLLTVHHIAADGWSLDIFSRELTVLYEAFLHGEPSPLLPLPLRYLDFAAREQSQLRNGAFNRDLGYWRRQLDDAVALELPTDFPRPMQRSNEGARHGFAIPANLSARIRRFSGTHEATPFMTLLAAFKLLLWRYSGETDISVGTASSHRSHEFESLIGLFVNPLVLRTGVSGELSFQEILSRVKRSFIDGAGHQAVPFGEIVKALSVERDASRTPLFDVMFVLNTAAKAPQLHGLQVSLLETGAGVSRFDLTLEISDDDGALSGWFEYNTRLFRASTIQQMADRFLILLARVLDNPDMRLERIPLLSPAETQSIIAASRGETPHSAGCCFPRVFEAWAESSAGNVAAVFQNREATYSELNRQANRIAHRLIELGTGPEVRVGVCLERSTDLLAAFLGVLKAGGVYVPLDPQYPAERLQWMAGSAQLGCIIGAEGLDGVLGSLGIPLLNLESDARLHLQPENNPSVPVHPENLAYVIFTSGSTGQPKAVMLEHRGLYNLQAAVRAEFGIEPGDRILQFASIGFDASVWEMAMALGSGASLVVTTHDVAASSSELAAYIDAHRATVATLPPTMLRLLSPRLPSLRLVVSAGEACTAEISAEWSSSRVFYNAYGPTESTVCATWAKCDAEAGRPSIGGPIANTSVYVLDAASELAADGIAGELYIGGAGIARGYLGNASLTAERFVPNPFAASPGERLYRTGDVVRRRDGLLEFLGRSDTQVKHHGHRIEPGEIEAALRRQAGVDDAVVVLRKGILTAYLAAPEAPAAFVTAIRQAMARVLPSWMQPGRYRVLDRLPTNASGKVDRKRLPAPDQVRDFSGPGHVEPSTEVEAQLAAIWQEVLNLERVGTQDNFFALGGDSILSIQVASRALRAGIRVTSRDIFQFQTIAELAGVAQLAPPENTAVEPLPEEAFPLTPIQEWFFEQEFEQAAHWNQSVLLELARPVDIDALRAAFTAAVTAHPALRLRFIESSDGWKQIYSKDAPPELEVIHLAGTEASFGQKAYEREAERLQSSLSLTEGPLIRAALFDLDIADSLRLLITAHHLVIDAVSWRILLEDLEAAYGQISAGRLVSLGPATASYAEWSRWSSALADSAAMREEEPYWSALHNAAPSRIKLDHDFGPNTTDSERTASFSLSETETAQLTEPLPMLLAAFASAAGAQSAGDWGIGAGNKTSSVLVDMESHGREQDGIDLSRSVGWFTSLYPLLVDIPESPGELLQAARDRLRAVPRQGIGFGILRYLARDAGRRDAMAALPRPQIALNYLGRLDMPGSAKLRLSGGSTGALRSPSARRTHVLELVAAIRQGRLELELIFSRNLHHPETIEALGRNCLRMLRELIALRRTEAARLLPAGEPVAQYRLTPLQEGLLFHTLKDGGKGHYWQQIWCRVRGSIDARTLEQAWMAAAAEHEVLRGAIHWEGLEYPLFCVFAAAPIRIESLDWSGVPEAESHENRLTALLDEDRTLPQDLSIPPLLRLRLIRLASDSSLLVWSFHHILLDGWSMPIVLRSLFRAYDAILRGEKPLQSATPAPQFGRYVAWLHAQDHAADREYWRSCLAGFTEPTPCPIPSRHPAGPSQPAEASVQLSAQTVELLTKICRSRRITLNTVLQGAWAVLLSRHSGQNDVVFGISVSGRDPALPGVEEIAGLLINTIPLRVYVSDGARVFDWLAELQSAQAESRRYETTSLALIQSCAEVDRGRALFSTLFVFENYPGDPLLRGAAGMPFALEEISSLEPTHYDLTLLAVPGPGSQLDLTLSYDADRCAKEAVEALLGRLETVLRGIAGNPDCRVADLPLANAEEQRAWLLLSEGDSRRDPSHCCVHELFEAQAARTPDAPAILFAGQSVSYEALNRKADGIARRLRALGVGPDVRVGVSLPRSIDLIAAVIGVLKAGGACVPLDPAYPAARLQTMAVDAAMAVRIEPGSPVLSFETLNFDEDRNPAHPASPENLAYVIYTSGSTGVPKGVAMPHGPLLNLLEWQAVQGGETGRTTLQFAPLSFDVGFQEIFSTLCFGGTLALVQEETRRDFPKLLAAIEEMGVERLFLPFVALQQLAEAAADCGFARPLRIVTAGEQLVGTPAVREFFQTTGSTLENQYGPTETHVVTCFALTGEPGDWDPLPPIGRPISHCRTYLLDSSLAPAPIGAAAELYIGGPVIARGYLGQPALTAERFLPDPYSPQPGARMYRTGDLCRWNSEGQLEFLGRADRQIKVRGYRIEPGEIEAVLSRHPSIRQCVAGTFGEGAAKRLAAWFVAAGEGIDAAALQQYLAERLPGHMVPQAFVPLPAIPLTPSGKVDRLRLPGPDRSVVLSPQSFVAPRSEMERTIAKIWSELLHVESIGIHDNFFTLGGHSLLAAGAVSRMRRALNRDIGIQELFDKPTIGQLCAAIDPAQISAPGHPDSIKAGADGSPVLSSAQQRMWFLHQLDPDAPTYNNPIALRIRGSLDADQLSAAFETILLRHSVLRTVYRSQDGVPVAEVQPIGSWRLNRIVLGATGGRSDGESNLEEFIARESRRAFDLFRELPVRALLIKTAEDEHCLVVTLHHVASDGWSVQVLFRELAALLNGDALSPLPIQYADFSRWQKDWLESDAARGQLDYWLNQLADVPQLDLIADSSAGTGATGACHELFIAAETVERLRQLGSEHGATLFMTLLTAFQVLLYRHTGQVDFCTGSPIAARTAPEVEPLIGCFVNMLPLRADLGGDPDFIEALARTRDTTVAAFANQDYPFDALVDALGLPRDVTRTPLFRTVFALQNMPVPELQFPASQIEPMDCDTGAVKFDLALELREEWGALHAYFEYSASIFDASTVRRIASRYASLLQSICAEPHRRLSELAVIPAEEQRQLQQWSEGISIPQQPTVVDLVRRHAAASPDFVAVRCMERALTYAELDEKANRLAHAMLDYGVRPGALVALLLEPSERFICAALGVLKAGAAFLPLDPESPQARLAALIEIAEPRLLMTTRQLAANLPQWRGAVLWIEDALANGRNENPNIPIDGADPAYAIFTSGSTGLPKPVLIQHHALANLCAWHTAAFGVTSHSRATQLANLSFDASVWEIWPYLAAGASVDIVPRETTPVIDELAEFIVAQSITHCFVPTPLAENLWTSLAGRNGDLRYLFTGGDALVKHPPAGLSFAVVNNYGPTEAAVVATSGILESSSGVPAIGRPIANVSVHVLGANLERVPIGCKGELYIAGTSVAVGYGGMPSQTAAHFLPDPFSAEPGTRMYRTGDLARYLNDGTLQFMGRADAQVKIRGIRIEPGEVETQLLTHPEVETAIVLAPITESAGPVLTAWVAPRGNHTGSALRRYLEERLPHSHIPGAFVFLDTLPLTPRGKVDREALLRLRSSELPIQNERGGSAGVMEEMLAGVWSELLGCATPGPADDFFDLGGHSLLAAQMTARIRGLFGVDLPLRTVFEAPTLEAFAARIAAARAGEAPELPKISDESGAPPVLSSSQQRLWFLDRLQPGSASYVIPFALRLRGELDREALRRAFEEIVRRHEVLRTTIDSSSGIPVPAVRPLDAWQLPETDLISIREDLREAELAARIQDLARQPFDLMRDVLLRTFLFRTGADSWVLLVTMHHIASDGASIAVLIREAAQIYAARHNGEAAEPPSLPFQYAAYAQWERRRIESATALEQLAWWKQQLAGAPVLDLPTDRPRPSIQTLAGAQVRFAVPPETVLAIRRLARRSGATPFMVVLAAFAVLLRRYSRQHDILIGVPVANRVPKETEALIGFFVNTLALRLRHPGDPLFAEFLDTVREVTLSAFAHQSVPIEKIVETLQPDRDLSRTPLFQVMFSWQHRSQPVELPGLSVSPVEMDTATAKFDLTLSVAEHEDSLEASLEYNCDLFDASTVQRMAAGLQTLLDGIAADSSRRVSALPLLASDEHRQIHEALTGQAPAEHLPACLHTVFERHAALSPLRPALTSGDQTLTYAELNSRANQVAHLLLSLGVGVEDRVAVLLDRTPELIAVLLGILKAGAAYVPIDPAYPGERQSFIMADSRVKLVITRTSLRDNLSGEIRTLCIDDDTNNIAPMPTDNPPPRTVPENLAYVIYTSGSTGKPKGVEVPHACVSRLFAQTDPWFGFSADDVWTLFHSIAFDFSVWELWGPFLYGGRLVLVPYLVSRSPQALLALLRRERVTVLNQTPSAFRVLSAALEADEGEDGGADDALSLRYVIFGGEVLEFESLRPWFRRYGGERPRLINMYGITETTVHVTWRPVLPDDLDIARGSLIGVPIPDLQLHILDEHQQPVPIGVAGELFVGGAGLARSYSGRPALTAERFIPDPFATRPGERLYRTGDLVCLRADGELRYVGRADHQVKIRGFRIEPGEIEQALTLHPDIGHAVVMSNTLAEGDVRLAAYWVPKDGSVPGTDVLRTFLRERLPEYMIPAAFVRLESLPLNSNGKVDRKRLPNAWRDASGSSAVQQAAAAYVEARNAVEECLAGIWKEQLGVERAGIHDSFFDLGGHSLLAVQLAARISRTFRIELPLIELFHGPTVANIANYLEQHEQVKGQVEKTARAWRRLRDMPADERAALLARKRLQKEHVG